MEQPRKKYHLLVFCFIFIALSTFVGALEFEPHTRGENLSYSFTSNAGISCNLTTANTPQGLLVFNQEATKNGQTFNITIPGENLSVTGNYCFNLECTDGSSVETGNFCRTITPSGSLLTNATSIIFFGSLIIMIIIGLIFLIIGTKVENILVKTSSISFGVISFVMAILYMVVSMQQALYGFEDIISGVETFWFVMKTLLGVGILALIIVVFMVLFKAWKIKRGFDD